ncbi:MAG: ribose-5-phosphate isomerase RpiA [Pseudomonadota bacterium]
MENQKKIAAEAALDFVDNGMKLGLGTGSTAEIFVELLGQRVADGLDVVCVPTSEEIKIKAELLSIPLTTLDVETELDLTVDGADEIDENLHLIKGGGGALLREKIVAAASQKCVIIAHENKCVEKLGAFPLPVEVVKFGLGVTTEMVQVLSEEAGCSGAVSLRKSESGAAVVTDEGHYLLDCHFNYIPSPEDLEDALSVVPGVVETGLFLNFADYALIGTDSGVKMIEAQQENTNTNIHNLI